MNHLTLTYRFDAGDDDGWLGVEVKSENFSGRGGFWVQWQEVEEFGQSLRAYPITSDAPIVREWGYEQCEGDALVIGIKVAAANLTGELNVSVEVANNHETAERVRTSFLTHYPQLEAFSAGIASLMARASKEAVLLGI